MDSDGVRKRPLGSTRATTRRCGFPECTKTAKPGGLCISHGGGKKCSVEGCTTSVVSRGFCVAHGGGKRCQREGCTKSAQTGGFCWIHGGGKKCGFDGCMKRAQSGGACISHGGGKRCRIENCNKVVQYDGLCVGHGGYRKCRSINCAKKALANGFCTLHGGKSQCGVPECGRKAVRGGLCSEHKAMGSPTQPLGSPSNLHRVARESLSAPSPHLITKAPIGNIQECQSIYSSTGQARGSMRPRSQSSAVHPLPRFSPALSHLTHDEGYPDSKSIKTEQPVTNHVLSRGFSLPSIRQLQTIRQVDANSSIPQQRYHHQPHATPIFARSGTGSPSDADHTRRMCHVPMCDRFAKIHDLCLLHTGQQPSASPFPQQPQFVTSRSLRVG